MKTRLDTFVCHYSVYTLIPFFNLAIKLIEIVCLRLTYSSSSLKYIANFIVNVLLLSLCLAIFNLMMNLFGNYYRSFCFIVTRTTAHLIDFPYINFCLGKVHVFLL